MWCMLKSYEYSFSNVNQWCCRKTNNQNPSKIRQMDLFFMIRGQKRLATRCGLKTVFFYSSFQNLTSDHQSRDFPPNFWFRPIVSPVSKCFFGALVLPKKGGQDVRIHQQTVQQNETLRWKCSEVWTPFSSLVFSYLVVLTPLKHINRNGFHLPHFRGENEKKTFEATTQFGAFPKLLTWFTPSCCPSQPSR